MEKVGIKFTNKDIFNLQFDISNIHHSLANGIRRTILRGEFCKTQDTRRVLKIDT